MPENSGTIFKRLVQIVVLADEIDIIARYRRDLEEAFTKFTSSATKKKEKEIGLRKNQHSDLLKNTIALKVAVPRRNLWEPEKLEFIF